MKRCFKCDAEKPLSEFYRHAQMADGHLNKCKECAKKDASEHREVNIERIREYDRNRPNAKERKERFIVAQAGRRKDKHYREDVNNHKKKWADANAIKIAAHIITHNHIRDGRLIKQPCEICGETKVDAHHDDYEKALEVRWLCRQHHAEHHKNERRIKRGRP